MEWEKRLWPGIYGVVLNGIRSNSVDDGYYGYGYAYNYFHTHDDQDPTPKMNGPGEDLREELRREELSTIMKGSCFRGYFKEAV